MDEQVLKRLDAVRIDPNDVLLGDEGDVFGVMPEWGRDESDAIWFRRWPQPNAPRQLGFGHMDRIAEQVKRGQQP